MRVFKRFSPATRISLGLVSLTVSLLLSLDLFFGMLPDDAKVARQVRNRISESLAVQLATLIQSNDTKTLRTTLEAVVARDGEVLSLGLRRSNGEVLAHAGDHPRHWVAPTGGRSTLTHVSVPVYADKKPWGQVEISFRPVAPPTLLGWLNHPVVGLTLLIATAGFIIYYLYLRRALEHLDPSAAIPERVRTAFDTLTEGVLVVDPQGRIMLANAAFRDLHPKAKNSLHGRRASDIEWLQKALASDKNEHPWARVMRERRTIRGEAIDIAQEKGESRKAIVNCSPIQDGKGAVRGCLVTFDDVTALDRANAELRSTLMALRASRGEIEKQNEELKQLASYDPLTGCMNRRSFFDAVQKIYRSARGTGADLCCIMTDIDRFKSFNDRFGHAVGDDVIRNVATMLQSSMRKQDLLCRYGGEEFCMVFPSTTSEQTWEVAERIRGRIEAECGPAISGIQGLKVTSSFGVSSIKFGGETLEELIGQADQALYDAKNNGRNRVERFDNPGQKILAVAGGKG